MADGKRLAFNLPRLTTEVDCAPIGYPGLEVHFWLNVTYDADRVTDEDWEKAEKQPIKERPFPERDYYYSLGRIIDHVLIPGKYLESEEPAVIQVGSGQALLDLMTTPGFEQAVVNWAVGQYYTLKEQRLRAESKN